MSIPTNNNGAQRVFESVQQFVGDAKSSALQTLDILKTELMQTEALRRLPSLSAKVESHLNKMWPSRIDVKLSIGSILHKILHKSENDVANGALLKTAGSLVVKKVESLSRNSFAHLENNGKASELVQQEGMEKIGHKLPYLELMLNTKIKESTISPENAARIQRELANLKEMVVYQKAMKADNFNDTFINNIILSRLQMREGDNCISSKFPKSLEAQPDTIKSGKMKDENGKEFGNLRGPDGLTNKDFAAFCNAQGGDFKLISTWLVAQGGDSWSLDSLIMKCLLLEARGEKADKYYWKEPFEGEGNLSASHALELRYSLLNDNQKPATLEEYKEIYNTSLAHWMAYNMEFLAHTEMSSVNKETQTMQLYRTESPAGLEANNININDTENAQTMKRSNFESGSILAPVFASGRKGSIVSIQEVPLHRCIFNYQLHPLMRDIEKEVGFMTDGIPFKLENQQGSQV